MAMATQVAPVTARFRQWVAACIATMLVAGAPCASAQANEEPPALALSGALQRIKAAGVMRIGYREHAVPFSFGGPGALPYGYSIDICQAIVESVAQAIGVALLRVEYRRVTPSDRIEQVVDGRIDLECGATTNTAERRKRAPLE